MADDPGPMGTYNERAVELTEQLEEELTGWGEKNWRAIAAGARELAEIAGREAERAGVSGVSS